MKKILIVGGAGFIGHNLALELNRDGNQVTIIDSLAVNNLFSVLDNKDNLHNPKLAEMFLNERLLLIKKNNIRMKSQHTPNFYCKI